jgi:hypothetical protein
MKARILETLATLMWVRRKHDCMNVVKRKAYTERRYLYVVLEMISTMH